MVTIAEIRPGRNPAWLLLTLSNGESLAFPADTWASLGLIKGEVLDEEALTALRSTSERACTLNYALRLLSVRRRSHSELRRRLQQRGHPADAIDEAVRWLAERDYLCDDEFARARVHDRLLGRPLGRRALIGDLRSRGIDAERAEAAVSAALDEVPGGEVALAREAAEKWLRTRGQRHDDPRKRREALRATLARRGFGFDAIREATSGPLD